MSENNKLDKNGVGISTMQASRARNRTVMLSSDVTGQMRALIQGDTSEPEKEEDSPVNHGFLSPSSIGQIYNSDDDADDTATGIHNSMQEIIGVDYSPKKLDIEFPQSRRMKTEVQERSVSPAMHDIRKSKELLAGNICATGASTLTHAVSSFDTEREQLAKARVGFKKSRILGFLISFDKDEHGEILEVREGRSIVSSKLVEQSDILLVDDDSVSNPHAVIKADKKGNIMLLDQLSESGSAVIRAGTAAEIDAVGTAIELRQGDIIRFGARYFIFCAVPKIAIQD